MDLSIGITFQKQRQHDRFLMDLLTPHFNSDILQKINRVRVALQVLTLADIADDGGRKLLPGIECGVLQRQSKFNWPKQPLYTPWLKHWQQACSILKRYISANRLGPWIKHTSNGCGRQTKIRLYSKTATNTIKMLGPF